MRSYIICALHQTFRWARRVADMGRITNVYRLLVDKPEEKTQLRDLGVYDRIILKCSIRNVECEDVG
jgi:hypothetical protein